MSCLVHFNYELTNICSYIFIIINEIYILVTCILFQ